MLCWLSQLGVDEGRVIITYKSSDDSTPVVTTSICIVVMAGMALPGKAEITVDKASPVAMTFDGAMSLVERFSVDVCGGKLMMLLLNRSRAKRNEMMPRIEVEDVQQSRYAQTESN